MSNELVRRICNALEAPQRKGELVQRVDVERRPVLLSAAPEIWARPRAGTVARVDHPPVLELPRWCALYDGEMSLARYLWRNGVYVYDDNIELTPAQKRRYSAGNAVPVPADFCPERECCAYCGKWTPAYALGAVSCCRCNPVAVCFGNTTPDRYFKCRRSCGQEGFLSDTGFDRVALVPGRASGSFGTRF